MAVSGQSPAVVLELLWWLCRKERAHIRGIEIWTTGKAEGALRTLLSEAWERFQDATAPLPPLAPDCLPGDPDGLHIHTFQRDGVTLEDVRDSDEASVVHAALHDRVRQLRDRLGPNTRLVGSLAGGRKVVSAALQTAFSLQARSGDRLVHVLLHPELDDWLMANRRLHDFEFPHAEWEEHTGVAVADQLTVYDVPFPRLRQLVPKRLTHALDAHSWDEVWPALQRNRLRDATATLSRNGDRWVYVIHDADGDRLYKTQLSMRTGGLLAAAVRGGDNASVSDLADWLDAHPAVWTPPGAQHEDRQTAVRSAASSLRRDLEDLPMGLERFTLPETGYHIAGNVNLSEAAVAGVPD